MATEELRNKLESFRNKFNSDEEALAIIGNLFKRFDEIQEEFFTNEDGESYEFDLMCEEYYSEMREEDPDDMTIFNVMWLMF
jgi:hypothetical protein